MSNEILENRKNYSTVTFTLYDDKFFILMFTEIFYLMKEKNVTISILAKHFGLLKVINRYPVIELLLSWAKHYDLIVTNLANLHAFELTESGKAWPIPQNTILSLKYDQSENNCQFKILFGSERVKAILRLLLNTSCSSRSNFSSFSPIWSGDQISREIGCWDAFRNMI